MRALFPTAEVAGAGENGGSRVGFVGRLGGSGWGVGGDICCCFGSEIGYSIIIIYDFLKTSLYSMMCTVQYFVKLRSSRQRTI